jgi:iron complex outermembrane recepter protein
MKRISVFLSCILVFAFSSAYSQEIDDETADTLFSLSLDEFLNVVITPSKSAQSVNDVTQKVDILSGKDLESTISGNRNLCENIAILPGMSVSVLSRNDANWGTYGGIGPKYSTYMLQGLPVDAFIDPMSLDLNAIDHIEVQRGPASVIYPNYLSQDFAGSQSPLAGTVNLILKNKIDRKKTTFRTSLGTYNTFNGQFYHQDKIERLNYFFGSSFEISDYTNYGTSDSWLNMKKDPEYKKNKVYAGLSFFIDKEEKQKLTLFVQRTWHNGDAGRVYKGFDNKYGTVNIGYDLSLKSNLKLQSHFGIRSYDRTWQESNYGFIDTLKSDNGVKQLIVPIDISLLMINGRSALSIGADYQIAEYSTWTDPLVGYPTYGNKSSAIQGGFYLQEEWRPVEGFTLRGGLRYTFIENNIFLENFSNPVDNNLAWDRLLWSAGLKYAITGKIAFYINAGTSFSAPGLKSIGGTIPLSYKGIPGYNGQLPNAGLKPEIGVGIDGGFDFSLPSDYRLSIRGFYTILNDGIIDNIVSRNPSQTQSINTKSESTGAELELTRRINAVLSLYSNITIMKTGVTNKLNGDQNNVEIPFSPGMVANIGANLHLFSNLLVSPSLNYNNGFYDGISKTDRMKYNPGVILNTYIDQKFIKNNEYEIDCFASLYNLTDNNYIMPWQFRNTGFSGVLGLKITF